MIGMCRTKLSQMIAFLEGPRTAEGMNLPKLFELITIEPAIIMNKKGRRRKASSIQGKSKKRSLTTPRKQGKKRNFPDETSSAPSPVSSSDTAESFEGESFLVTHVYC